MQLQKRRPNVVLKTIHQSSLPTAQLGSVAASTEPVTTNGLGLESFSKACNERFAARNGLLNRGQRQRRSMAFSTVPHLSYPDGIRISWILRDYVAKATRHATDALDENGDQRVPSPRQYLYLSDQTIHECYRSPTLPRFYKASTLARRTAL